MADETQASRNAEGFFFLNAEDAGMALKEKKQIEYLEANLNFGNPEQVLTLYERMLRERVFKTPVGVIYLKHLQDFLLSQESIDSARVPMIPVYAPCADGPQRQERPRRAVAAPRTGEAKQDSARLRLSIFLNVLLAAAVIAMFVMALSSSQPNILNYRTTILNEYASWQQDLAEREQITDAQRRLGGAAGGGLCPLLPLPAEIYVRLL